MGNYISSLRAHVMSNVGSTPQSRDTTSTAPTATTNASNNQTTNSIYPASSRLNLINQLIGLGGSAVASRGKKASALNDFQNVTFANHFFMAGRRFKNIITQAQTFLFGDQLDLGFLLAHKPILVFIRCEILS